MTRSTQRGSRRATSALSLLAASAAAMGTVTFAPDADAASGSTVLTVSGAGYIRNPMSTELRGDLCKTPNVCQEVAYPTVGLFNQPLIIGLANLTKAIDATEGPKVVMAYSQGALIATSWLEKNASSADSPGADEMTLVLFGNPQRGKNGNVPTQNLGSATPTDTKYTVVDVCRQYDGECDWPNNPFNGLALLNAFMGYTSIHNDYTGVDYNASENWVQKVGNTTYVLVPTDGLPLLSPLRQIGLGGLADQLEPMLRPIIDSAYNRSGYKTIGETGPVDPFPSAAGDARSSVASVPGSVSRLSVTVPASAAVGAGGSATGEPAEPVVSSPSVAPTASGGSNESDDAPDADVSDAGVSAVSSESTHSDSTDSDSTQPDSTQPDSTQPDSTQPDSTRPDSAHSDSPAQTDAADSPSGDSVSSDVTNSHTSGPTSAPAS